MVCLTHKISDRLGQPELRADAQLLASIPGIGVVTVAKVLAYAGNVNRFDNAKAIIAAAMHKLTHLICGVLKTRQPFVAN